MRKITRNIIALIMAILTITSTSITALAVENSNEEYGVDTPTAQTNVYLNVDDSDILVSVPKTVIVSGTRDENDNLYKGYYGVSVNGDWSGSSVVNVVPDEEVELTQSGKKNVTASISQTKTSWAVNETDEIATGTISTKELSAGSWNGVFNFNISYEESSGIPSGYTVLYKYDLSATKDDDVAAYYCVPNENTEPIEIATSSESSSLLSRLSDMISPLLEDEENIVEYNGVKYTLSDDDTLVISGEGQMKEAVYKDLYDLAGVSDNVTSKYTVNQETAKELYETRYPNRTFTEAKFNGINVDCYGNISVLHVYYGDTYNWGLHCGYAVNTFPENLLLDDNGNAVTGSDIQTYVNSIMKNYVVSLPKKIIIKNGVTNISNNAFDGCKSIEEVEVGNTVKSIGTRAFTHSESLTKINFPDSLETIGSSAFSYTKLADIKLGKSMKSVGGSAFSYCSKLENVDLGPSVERLEGGTFEACYHLSYVKFPLSLKYCGTNSFASGSPRTEYEGTVDDWCNITFKDEYATPTRISNNKGFYANGELVTNVKLHTESIGNFAFYGCKSLESVEFADTVHTIGQQAFASSGLTSIHLPSTITKYGYQMFANCNSLTSAKLDFIGEKENLASNWFYYCKALERVELADTIQAIPAYSFIYCESLTDINIPTSVMTIGTEAFYNCNQVTHFDLPETLVSIGNYAFAKTGITEIELPNSLESIGDAALSNTAITTIKIPEKVTVLPASLFASSSLERIVIPNGVTTLGRSLFRNCSSLKYVYIPESVTSADSYLFYELPTTLTVGPKGSGCNIELGDMTTIPAYLFHSSNIKSVVLPNTVEIIGTYAFNKTEIVEVRVPDGVTEIGSSAFNTCASLETVYLPNSLTKINTSAFTGMAEGSVIYCESQEVADLLLPSGRASKYTASKTTVIVDATKF